MKTLAAILFATLVSVDSHAEVATVQLNTANLKSRPLISDPNKNCYS